MNGDEMNSASILMNLAPAAPAATATATAGAEQASPCAGAFDQTLAGVQSQYGIVADVPETEPVTLELASSLLLPGTLPVGQGVVKVQPVAEPDMESGGDAAEDAAETGVAAILAQMLAGSSPVVANEPPPVADAAVQATSMQSAAPLSGGAKPVVEGTPRIEKAGEGGSSASDDKSGIAPGAVAATLDSAAADSQPPAATMLQEKSFDMPSGSAQPAQSSTQSGSTAQAVVQAAASALREVAPAAASTGAVHATLRQPVGSARWADELGNHLVLMSVRGQQQGSLTLTPEHLGPVEVQISVNRDTANVWFGAQHADTRTALAEAMPRLRELLASSGLSLGQSGVSEQAPRENPVPPSFLAGGGPRGIDADASVENAAPAWRVWRPGHIDTYA
jgi:flagellar hook-length control protein FliK